MNSIMARKVFLTNREGDIPLLPYNDSKRVRYNPLDRDVEDILTELLSRECAVSKDDLTNITNQITEINNLINGDSLASSLRMSVKATYTVGGVPKGKRYENELVTTIIRDILSPYVAPKITFTGGKTLTLGKTYNIDLTATVEQGSVDITEITFDGERTALVNNKATKTFNFSPAQTDTVIVAKADDGKNVSESSVKFEVYEGLYIIFSPLTTPTTLDVSKCFDVGKTPDGIYTVENSYDLAFPFFFCSSRSTINRIVANNIEVPMEFIGSRTITHNGAVGQYKVYKGKERAEKDTIKYYINPK